MSAKILNHYIGKNVLLAIGLVTLLLAGLQIFILLVGQLDDLGKGDYGIWQSVYYVFMQVPYQIYLFFPIASLLGCLIGLGALANNSELIVMRAAGMSIVQITLAVLRMSMWVIILVTTLGETVVPLLSHQANDYKRMAVSGGQTLRTAQGIWLRYGADFISIGSISPNNILYDVYQFRFDPQHHLILARSIKEIHYAAHFWMAYDVKQSEFFNDQVKATDYVSLPWDVNVKPSILKINNISPDEMSLHELNRYLREQKKHTLQNTHQYQFAFLQRIIQPFTTMVMMILAIPFIFGPLRSSSMGSKLLVGATIGFGFHIINKFFGPVSAVFQWPIALAAFGPTVIFALVGLYLMRRVR